MRLVGMKRDEYFKAHKSLFYAFYDRLTFSTQWRQKTLFVSVSLGVLIKQVVFTALIY